MKPVLHGRRSQAIVAQAAAVAEGERDCGGRQGRPVLYNIGTENKFVILPYIPL